MSLADLFVLVSFLIDIKAVKQTKYIDMRLGSWINIAKGTFGTLIFLMFKNFVINHSQKFYSPNPSWPQNCNLIANISNYVPFKEA